MKNNSFKLFMILCCSSAFAFNMNNKLYGSIKAKESTTVVSTEQKPLHADLENNLKFDNNLSTTPISFIWRYITWAYEGDFKNWLKKSLGIDFFNPKDARLDKILAGLDKLAASQQEILIKLNEFYNTYLSNEYFYQSTHLAVIKNNIRISMRNLENLYNPLSTIEDFNKLPVNIIKEIDFAKEITNDNLKNMENYAMHLSGVSIPNSKLQFNDHTLEQYLNTFYKKLVNEKIINLSPIETNENAISILTNDLQNPKKSDEQELAKYNMFANKIYYDNSVNITILQVASLLNIIYKYELFAAYLHFNINKNIPLPPSLVRPKNFEEAKLQLEKLFIQRANNIVKISKEAKNLYNLDTYIKGDWYKTIYKTESSLNDFVHNTTNPVLSTKKDANGNTLVEKNNLYYNGLFLRAYTPKGKELNTNTRACNLTIRATENALKCDTGIDNFNYSFVDFNNFTKVPGTYSTTLYLKNNSNYFKIISNLNGDKKLDLGRNFEIPTKNSNYAYLVSYKNNMFYISNVGSWKDSYIHVDCIKYDNNCSSKITEYASGAANSRTYYKKHTLYFGNGATQMNVIYSYTHNSSSHGATAIVRHHAYIE
ncbi:MAG TPA: hypothetical protein PKD00_06530 [Burkholderiales bacterium]|nr:hypothetical protein [Burkholderiales bacterium]